MFSSSNYDEIVSTNAALLGGVFSVGDLSTLFAIPHRNQLYRVIRRLEASGTLRRFCRGYYLSPNFLPKVLSQRLAPDSYISCTTVLAEQLAVGTAPQYQVDAIKAGKSVTHCDGTFTVRHFGCKAELVFGYNTVNGIREASLEKALLDTLYFHQRGVVFPFDLYSDLNLSQMDRATFLSYLESYKNPRFRSFAMGILDAAA